MNDYTCKPICGSPKRVTFSVSTLYLAIVCPMGKLLKNTACSKQFLSVKVLKLTNQAKEGQIIKFCTKELGIFSTLKPLIKISCH